MRLHKKIITDHSLLVNVGEDDHHNRGISATVLINSYSISPSTIYEHRISLGKTGFKVFRGLLRGKNNVDIQGHDGAFVIASDVVEESSAIGICPYGGSYVTSYMGSYSRIHGDAYLVPYGIFGPSIVLQDTYIDGDEAVLEFYNSSGSSQNLTCYGTLAIK
jgi:hypothetical protein